MSSKVQYIHPLSSGSLVDKMRFFLASVFVLLPAMTHATSARQLYDVAETGASPDTPTPWTVSVYGQANCTFTEIASISATGFISAGCITYTNITFGSLSTPPTCAFNFWTTGTCGGEQLNSLGGAFTCISWAEISGPSAKLPNSFNVDCDL